MKILLSIFITALLIGCASPSVNSEETDLNDLDSLPLIDSSTTEPIIPVFGFRFMITGDFNGDKKQDTLFEHYISQNDFEETEKFYQNLPDYDALVDTTMKKRPLSYIACSNSSIDSLIITDREQQLGLSFLKNEGDLDGDGNDEVSYVINWADWSNMNSWNIISYKNGKWINLYSFSIRDWQLPDLPETINQYGFIGLMDKTILDSSNQNIDQINKEFLEFPGLVRKVKTNKIEIIYCNEEAMLDTTIIDLRSEKLKLTQ